LLSKGLLKTKKRPITCLPNKKKRQWMQNILYAEMSSEWKSLHS
jgi:hypothetical protein